jgi:hypothetical protein
MPARYLKPDLDLEKSRVYLASTATWEIFSAMHIPLGLVILAMILNEDL